MSDSSNLIDGKAVAEKLQVDLKQEVEQLISQGVSPKMAVVWVGDDPASGSYFRAKERLAKRLGIEFHGQHLPDSTSEHDLEKHLEELNWDDDIHAILVELPLPKQIDQRIISRMLSPQKDVDGITYYNQGRLYVGRDAFVPATPYGVMKLLEAYDVPVKGADAVVIGHGDVVGKPLATLLLGANATVTVCHEFTEDLKIHTMDADILCSATGVAHLVSADIVKPGAVVIDIGYSETEDGVVGDVDFDAVKEIASLITPVRGGVGAMTSTMIMTNTIKAAKQISQD